MKKIKQELVFITVLIVTGFILVKLCVMLLILTNK